MSFVFKQWSNIRLYAWVQAWATRTLSLTLVSGTIVVSPIVRAQLVPDGTLGAEASTLGGSAANRIIQGGALRGINLFHSFAEFNVAAGQRVFFETAGAQNIFSRVTGGNASSILGTLGSGANLFLLNPNGILFGANARLEVNGSFVATTANGIQFGANGVFGTAPAEVPSPLLTVNPSALLFNPVANRQGTLQNLSIADAGLNANGDPAQGLRVLDGSSLLLVGGDVRMEGGGLYALGGRVEIGSVTNGTVPLAIAGTTISLAIPDTATLGDVALAGARIDVGSPANSTGIAGDAVITASNVTLADSMITSRAASDGAGFGFVGITARDGSIALTDNSQISTTNAGRGFAGDISLTASGDIDIRDSSIFSRGNLGRILLGESDYATFSPSTVRLANSLLETSNSSIAPGGAPVNAGVITVQAFSLVDINNSDLLSRSERAGDAGGVGIVAGSFRMTNGSRISTSAFADGGNAGLTLLLVGNDATLDNSNIFSNLSGVSTTSSSTFDLSRFTDTGQEAGAILIGAGSLSLLNGAQIQTRIVGSSSAQANAGNILIAVDRTVKVIGTNAQGFSSAIFADVGENASGTGGTVFVFARSLHVREGGYISVSNTGSGAAGNVELFTRAVWVDSNGSIAAGSLTGQGGNIFLNVPGAVILGRGGDIFTFSGSDQTAAQSQSLFRADAGNIAIGSGNLLFVPTQRRNGDQTSAFTFDDRTLLVATTTPSDNNIFAIGLDSAGGNIRVQAGRLQGITERSTLTPVNDITTFSFLGVDGTTVVNTLPDIDPSRGLVSLPDSLIDVSRLVADGCDPRHKQAAGTLVSTGRGGVPSTAAETQVSPAILANARSPSASLPAETDRATRPASLVAAQGWTVQPNGDVYLVANASTTSLQVPWLSPSTCSSSSSQ